MEVDYIRRKPLITVTVEVEVGGEGLRGFLVPECSLRAWICVSRVHCHMHICTLACACWFLLNIFSSHCLKKERWDRRGGNVTTVSRQQTVNSIRKPPACQRHPVLPTAHSAPAPPLLVFFQSEFPVSSSDHKR